MPALAAEKAAEHAQAFYQDAEFWVLVAFVIFVAAVAKPATRRITQALDLRSEAIAKELDEAARLREEAAAALAAYQRKQRDAGREAQEILAHAEAEAKRMSEAATADLAAALKRREQLATDKIAQAEVQAVEDVREAIVDIALAATRELIKDNLDEKQSATLIDEAIKDLPEKLHWPA